MAVDMFLKIDGIDGESNDDKHKSDIEVLAWSWGLSNGSTFGTGGGGGSGKVNVQDLSITKYVDKASTKLMLACCQGDHIKTGTLFVRKAGTQALEYLKITLAPLMISAISTGGSGGEERLTEHVTLSFGSFKAVYQPQDSKGQKDGGELIAGWDHQTNKKL